jgi:hypothetical protein
MTFRFTPTAAGTLSGKVTFFSNDPANLSAAVTVSGVASLASGGGGNACIAPPANQITWLKGEGNANDTLGANPGTLLGNPTFAIGKVGQAFQFNGSTGYVSLGNPASLRLTSAITLEAWINPSAGPSTGTLIAIVTKWGQDASNNGASDSYGMWLERAASGGIDLFVALHQTNNAEPHANGGSIPLNTWTHVAMTFDSSTGALTLYVNGQAVGTVTSAGSILPTSRNVFVGREDSYLPRAFSGLVDEVGIYSRALSPIEIQRIYAAGGSGKCF